MSRGCSCRFAFEFSGYMDIYTGPTLIFNRLTFKRVTAAAWSLLCWAPQPLTCSQMFFLKWNTPARLLLFRCGFHPSAPSGSALGMLCWPVPLLGHGLSPCSMKAVTQAWSAQGWVECWLSCSSLWKSYGWVQILALLLTGCVTLGKLGNLSVPQFLHL